MEPFWRHNTEETEWQIQGVACNPLRTGVTANGTLTSRRALVMKLHDSVLHPSQLRFTSNSGRKLWVKNRINLASLPHRWIINTKPFVVRYLQMQAEETTEASSAEAQRNNKCCCLSAATHFRFKSIAETPLFCWKLWKIKIHEKGQTRTNPI